MRTYLHPPPDPSQDLEPRVLCLLEGFSRRLAALTADWVRVGYCQGNFNADNCLVGGRTMDYGPFGFIQRFEVADPPPCFSI